MKCIRSYLLITIVFGGVLPLKGMLSRLAKVPKAPQLSRRSASGAPKSFLQKNEAVGVSQAENINFQQKSFTPIATTPSYTQQVSALLKDINKTYQASYLSSLVTPLAWSAALALLPFGIVIIDLDKVMDGLKTVRKNIGIFFAKISEDSINKSAAQDKYLPELEKKSEETSKK